MLGHRHVGEQQRVVRQHAAERGDDGERVGPAARRRDGAEGAVGVGLEPADAVGEALVRGAAERVAAREQAAEEDAGVGVDAHVRPHGAAEVVRVRIDVNQVPRLRVPVVAGRDLRVLHADRQHGRHAGAERVGAFALERRFRDGRGVRAVAPADRERVRLVHHALPGHTRRHRRLQQFRDRGEFAGGVHAPGAGVDPDALVPVCQERVGAGERGVVEGQGGGRGRRHAEVGGLD